LGSTLIADGDTWTFVASDPGAKEIVRGATAEDSIDAAVTAFNGAGSPVNAATYSKVGTTILRAIHDTPGSAGNDFTAGGTAAVASSPTMLGGAEVHEFVSGLDD